MSTPLTMVTSLHSPPGGVRAHVTTRRRTRNLSDTPPRRHIDSQG